MTEQTAGIGHNNPPPYDADVYADLERRIAEFNEAAAEFLRLGEIEDSDQAARLNDFLTGARQLEKQVDQARVEQKRPWDERARAVQSAFKTLMGRIEKIKTEPKRLQVEWLRREEKRLAEERQRELDRIAEERRKVAERAAQAQARQDLSGHADVEAELEAIEKQEKRLQKAEPRARAESATGGAKRQGLRRIRRGRIVNRSAVLVYYRDAPEITETLQRLVDRDVRARDVDETRIPGIETYEEETV